MQPIDVFLLVYCTLLAIAGLIGVAIGHYDRIAVFLIRRLELPVCADAISIAVLIVKYPEQWSSNGYSLSHSLIGTISTCAGVYGIEVKTDFGIWRPNRIERRIIRQAVDWRVRQHLSGRITSAYSDARVKALVSSPISPRI